MKHALTALAAAGTLVLGAALSAPPAARAGAPPPAADLIENFDADPLAAGLWQVTGPISWSAATKAAVSAKSAAASAVYAPGLPYAGTLAARVKLAAGAPANASLLFGVDPATGDHRWVKISAGAPGKVALGTTTGGVAKTLKSVKVDVPLRKWLALKAAFDGAGKVTVTLGTKKLFTAAVAPAGRFGRVGFATAKSAASFDSVALTGAPDAEPCVDCHRGQAAGAPPVYAYWDGTWWDGARGGSASVQQGGHGDPGGRPAVACAGAGGCHDLRQPEPGAHRNGVLEPRDAPTTNPYHLRAGFIAASPASPWTVQVTFDDFCTACHAATGVPEMRHERDTQPGQSGHGAVQLGTHSTAEEPAPGSGVLLDHDLTTAAGSGAPRYVVCVSCHDPHGTAVAQVNSRGSNLMLRAAWNRELCVLCHR